MQYSMARVSAILWMGKGRDHHHDSDAASAEDEADSADAVA